MDSKLGLRTPAGNAFVSVKFHLSVGFLLSKIITVQFNILQLVFFTSYVAMKSYIVNVFSSFASLRVGVGVVRGRWGMGK